MLICRTPFRVSLFGGGTDYPQYFRHHGGIVVGMAIDKYGYIALRKLPPFFDCKYRITYSTIEQCNTIDEIQHPAIRAALDSYKVADPLEISYFADLPARSGTGSSSSFAVGLIHALSKYQQRERVKKQHLANEAIHLERNILQENVGCQDQIFAAFGGAYMVEFHPYDFRGRYPDYTMNPVVMLPNVMESLVLVGTRQDRIASQVTSTYRTYDMGAVKQIAYEGIKAIESGDIEAIGRLLSESWEFKRSLSNSVSNTYLDSLYHYGMKCGALGGKLIGAGGGGFFLFVVPPDKRPQFDEATKDLIKIPFKEDTKGSTIIYG